MVNGTSSSNFRKFGNVKTRYKRVKGGLHQVP